MAVPPVTLLFPESAIAAATKNTPNCRIPPAIPEVDPISTPIPVRFFVASATRSFCASCIRAMFCSALELLITANPVRVSLSMPV